MTSNAKQEIKTFATEKVPLPPCEKDPSLLPLLTPNPDAPNSRTPPLHLHPNGHQLGNKSKKIIYSEQNVNWIATTTVFPSAYPTSHIGSTSFTPDPRISQVQIPSSISEAEAQETKLLRAKELREWKDFCEKNPPEGFYPPLEEEVARSEAEKLKSLNVPQLWSCVERIAPTDSNGNLISNQGEGEGITLVLAHGNGNQKETWEPSIQDLLSCLSKDFGQHEKVDEIWSLDRSDSGEAGGLNREVLGDVVSAFDYPRDFSQLLNHYLPSKKLEDLGDELKKTENGQGRKGRRLVGVGHSFGGTALALLSNAEPDLFERIILFDPAIRPVQDLVRYEYPVPISNPVGFRVIGRRNAFSSRTEAEKYFHSKGFFRGWDPRAIEIQLEFGLRPLLSLKDHSSQEVRNGPCCLSTNKLHQAFVFSFGFPGRFSFPAFERGSHKESTYIISPTKGFFPPEVLEKVRKLTRDEGDVVEATHLLVHENPDIVGTEIVKFLPLASEKSARAQQNSEKPQAKL